MRRPIISTPKVRAHEESLGTLGYDVACCVWVAAICCIEFVVSVAGAAAEAVFPC